MRCGTKSTARRRSTTRGSCKPRAPTRYASTKRASRCGATSCAPCCTSDRRRPSCRLSSDPSRFGSGGRRRRAPRTTSCCSATPRSTSNATRSSSCRRSFRRRRSRPTGTPPILRMRAARCSPSGITVAGHVEAAKRPARRGPMGASRTSADRAMFNVRVRWAEAWRVRGCAAARVRGAAVARQDFQGHRRAAHSRVRCVHHRSWDIWRRG
mmetsp:Transcript_49292/g.136679  ORF Transcript_49292/g.136679 Transcript_49292/m.136679 type:complete len:211 (-) Transcript_49292:111-743(-)